MREDSGRRKITVDAVFDIETEDWATFVCGGFLLATGEYEEFRYEKGGEIALAERLLGFDGTVWGHNGGGFDFKWLLDFALAKGLQARITSAGGTIISILIGKLRLFDSFALTKISLAKFSEGTGVEKSETGLACICGGYCGGYCSISRGMARVDYEKLLAYLKRDCEGLFQSLTTLQEFAAVNDLDLGATVGGSAWRNAQRLLDLPKAALDVTDHMFARDAYFGGRVQLFKPVSFEGWEYDVNSMYPSRLAQCPVPTGVAFRDWGRGSQEKLDANCPGFYKCEVTVARGTHLPPLPVRTRERVLYPTGTFRGTWALPELQLAKELDCEISAIESLTFSNQEVIFKPWIDRLFNVRTNAPGGKSGAMGTFIKYYMNSLAGKFGSKPQSERVMLNVPTDKIRVCRCKHDCQGACGCDTPLDIHGEITVRKTFRIDNCAHVEWAAYLTSEARCEWLRFALSHDGTGRGIVYGDTDSVFSENEMFRNIGNALGQWQCQGRYYCFEGIAPKVYTFKREEGKRVLKAKGVSLPRLKDAPKEVQDKQTEINMVKMFAGETFRKSGPQGFRKGAKNGRFFEKSNAGRSVSRGFGDRTTEQGNEFTNAPVYDPEIHGTAESDSGEEINAYEEIINEGEAW